MWMRHYKAFFTYVWLESIISTNSVALYQKGNSVRVHSQGTKKYPFSCVKKSSSCKKEKVNLPSNWEIPICLLKRHKKGYIVNNIYIGIKSSSSLLLPPAAVWITSNHLNLWDCEHRFRFLPTTTLHMAWLGLGVDGLTYTFSPLVEEV
jgi:hypothetical protein